MNVLLIFTTMFLLMFLGTDIFVSMGIAAVAYLLVTGNAPLTLISQNMIKQDIRLFTAGDTVFSCSRET